MRRKFWGVLTTFLKSLPVVEKYRTSAIRCRATPLKLLMPLFRNMKNLLIQGYPNQGKSEYIINISNSFLVPTTFQLSWFFAGALTLFSFSFIQNEVDSRFSIVYITCDIWLYWYMRHEDKDRSKSHGVLFREIIRAVANKPGGARFCRPWPLKRTPWPSKSISHYASWWWLRLNKKPRQYRIKPDDGFI